MAKSSGWWRGQKLVLLQSDVALARAAEVRWFRESSAPNPAMRLRNSASAVTSLGFRRDDVQAAASWRSI